MVWTPGLQQCVAHLPGLQTVPGEHGGQPLRVGRGGPGGPHHAQQLAAVQQGGELPGPGAGPAVELAGHHQFAVGDAHVQG